MSKVIKKLTFQSIIVQKQSSGVFCKKGDLGNFAEFKGKHLRQRLFFNEVAGLRAAALSKRSLWHECFL